MSEEALKSFDQLYSLSSNIKISHLEYCKKSANNVKSDLLQTILEFKEKYQNSGPKNLNVVILLEKFNHLAEFISIPQITRNNFINTLEYLTSLLNSLSVSTSNTTKENTELREEVESLKLEIKEMQETIRYLLRKCN